MDGRRARAGSRGRRRRRWRRRRWPRPSRPGCPRRRPGHGRDGSWTSAGGPSGPRARPRASRRRRGRAASPRRGARRRFRRCARRSRRGIRRSLGGPWRRAIIPGRAQIGSGARAGRGSCVHPDHPSGRARPQRGDRAAGARRDVSGAHRAPRSDAERLSGGHGRAGAGRGPAGRGAAQAGRRAAAARGAGGDQGRHRRRGRGHRRTAWTSSARRPSATPRSSAGCAPRARSSSARPTSPS